MPELQKPSYEQVGSNILVMLKLLPYTMTQKLFQGISECVFRVTRPDNSQSRARSWFFLSLYCLYKNAAEKKIIKIKELTANKVFANPIVTEVKPVTDFYEAEDYHQDYVKHNPNQPYVKGVSVPRYNKFKKHIKES
jgi:peptide-methionine (S)-S-oxide reductase